MATYTGTTGNDTFDGGADADTIDGAAGNDTLRGLAGNDSIVGGAGNDNLQGGEGNDTLRGGNGIDTLDGGAGIDWLYYDVTTGAMSVNLATGVVSGTDGADVISNLENVLGSPNNDTLFGGTGPNEISGANGNDSLRGGDGDDLLLGGAGPDSLRGDAGNDTLDGGAILDRISYSDGNLYTWSTATTGVTVDLSGITGDGSTGFGTVSDGLGGTDRVANVFSILTSPFNDRILGSTALTFESFDGGAGDDTIDGGEISDRAFARNANRVIYTNATQAVVVDLAAGTATGHGNDTLLHISHVRGSAFADQLLGSDNPATYREHLEGREGNDTLDGRGGQDLARYDNAPAAVNANLVTGIAQDGYGGTDRLLNIEGLRGSNFNDTLTGGAPENGSTATGVASTDGIERFQGDEGNDLIDGGQGYDRAEYLNSTAAVVARLGGAAAGTAADGLGGTDTLLNIEGLVGSDFNDTLTGSDAAYETFEGREGADSIDGGAGIDLLSFGGDEQQGALVNLATGEVIDGFGTRDVVANVEWLRGTRAYGDQLTGDAQANRVDGDEGDDTLAGGDGNDTLLGSAGNDRLDGGPGDYDWFDGGEGNDTIDGGATLAGRFGVDIVRYDTSAAPLTLNLATGSATQGAFTDALSRINAVFAGAGNDTLRGADSALERDRGETLRGGAGNDSIDGGSGVDSAEFRGPRSDYTLTALGNGSWTVRDNNPDPTTGGDEGTDTLTNIERIVFADQMLAFGSRAEELVRVAAVLWSPAILGSATLFSRGYSYYDNGYGLEDMSRAALQFWTAQSDAQLAQLLVTNSGSTSKTAADLLATMANNGGGVFGRAAAVREAALDAGVTAFIESSGLRTSGVVSVNEVPGFGVLFDLLPGG